MDTQNLKAFLLVAETGSFSIAAQKLHLTQPAVSKRVAQLEEQLNVSLFDRIGRTISTTEAGQALLPHARAVQLELQAAEQSVRDLAGEVRGRLRLATSHHIGLHRLPPVLSFFSKAYPAVQLDIEFMDSEQAYDLTLRGEVELFRHEQRFRRKGGWMGWRGACNAVPPCGRAPSQACAGSPPMN